MAEPEFSARGVQIGKKRRSLTRAGQVLISNGRLRLLTSRGTEIDSAPVDRVDADTPWYAGRGSARATINGTRYLIELDGKSVDSSPRSEKDSGKDGQGAVRRFLDALHDARRS